MAENNQHNQKSMAIPLLDDFDTFEEYDECVKLWQHCSKVDKKERGALFLMTVPVDSAKYGAKLRKGLCAKVKPLSLADNENGVNLIMEYLRDKLAQNPICRKLDTFCKTVDFRRKPGQDIKEYIDEFEMNHQEGLTLSIPWEDEIIAYLLVRNAGLNEMEYKMLRNNLDIEATVKQGKLYNVVKTRMLDLLTKTLGDVVAKGTVAGADVLIVEEHQDVFVAQGWKPPKKGNGYKGYNRVSTNYKSDHRPKYKSDHRPNYNPNQQQTQGKPLIGTNKIGIDGKRMQCKACNSTFHLIANCPHAKAAPNVNKHSKGARKREAYIVEVNAGEDDNLLTEESSSDESSDQEHVSDTVWLTTPGQMSDFVKETLGCGSFDTGCTSSVAGEVWKNNYIDELSNSMKAKVVGPLKSGRSFMFGNQGVLTSGARYKLPVIIRGEEHTIEVDIIDSDIPLLISRKEMAKLDISINNKNDTATMRGKPLPIMTTSAGHLIVDLLGRKQRLDIDRVLNVELMGADEITQKKALEKIHKQFGHRRKRAFVQLLKNCGSWKPKFSGMINEIIDGCEGCIMRKRNPDRPAVAMPMATEFNEIVTMDLKIWKGKIILYMIDAFTRYTMAVVVQRKEPEMIVDAMMKSWIKYFGIMGGILTDNGGEFSSALTREVVSILDVMDHTTGAEAPWSNGLCEKNHALADNILQSVMRDYPDMKIDAALAWACVAKNSLTNHFGFSPYQLVFGRNPRLPNVINDPPPSWEIKTKSQSLMENLKAMHATRQAFIKAESCERLKTALRSKIRTSTAIYQNGEIVYYKRDNEEEWRGPAKVVCQDGKVIFIRHGGYIVRVSPNRLVHAGRELQRRIREDHEEFQLEKEIEAEEKGEKVKKPKQPKVSIIITDSELEEKSEEGTDREVNNEAENIDRREDDESEKDDEDSRNEEDIKSEDNINAVEANTLPRDTAKTQPEKRKASSPAKGGKPGKAAKVLTTKFKAQDRIEVKDGEQWKSGIIMNRAGKADTATKHWWNVRLDDGKEFSTDVSKNEVRKADHEQALYTWMHEDVLAVMIPKDQRNTPECLVAKNEELKKLADFKTYKVVEDKGQPYISTTWVMTEKGSEVRARLTARGYEEEEDFPKDSPTMQRFSFRILLSLAAVHGWNIETTDIKSAFLQGSKLERTVHVKPPREAEMKGKLWLLEKCLYGLKDASRQWYKKVAAKLDALGFKRSKYDFGLFYKLHGGRLIGLIGLHVDDFLTCGNKMFEQNILPELLKSFIVGKSESEAFTYTGFKITQTKQGIVLDQSEYVSNIVIPVLDAERLKQKDERMEIPELSHLRHMVGTLNWTVGCTRPDLSFDMINLSTKFKGGKVEDLVMAKKILVNLQRNAAYVTISNVQPVKQCKIWCYSDAAFRNLNEGVDSAGGFVILIVNTKSGLCAPIDWKANKIKRKVASTLAAETISLGTALDAAVGIRDMIVEITGGKVTLQIKALVDNKSCRDAVYSTTSVTERRLRAEIAVIKELEEEKIISEVKWIRGEFMLADIMTKKGVNNLPLSSVMQQGKISRELMAVCK